MVKVFIIPFHVKGMENSIMPPEISGAYVSCYTSGENYVEATEKSIKKLQGDGLHPEEILQPINEMDSRAWEEHAQENWPDYLDSLPSQMDFEASMKSGLVIYGPFGSYIT